MPVTFYLTGIAGPAAVAGQSAVVGWRPGIGRKDIGGCVSVRRITYAATFMRTQCHPCGLLDLYGRDENNHFDYRLHGLD